MLYKNKEPAVNMADLVHYYCVCVCVCGFERGRMLVNVVTWCVTTVCVCVCVWVRDVAVGYRVTSAERSRDRACSS